MGAYELRLIADADFAAFPPKLPEQPIFNRVQRGVCGGDRPEVEPEVPRAFAVAVHAELSVTQLVPMDAIAKNVRATPKKRECLPFVPRRVEVNEDGFPRHDDKPD